MADYGTVVLIKERLHITDTDHDTEITTCLASAEAWMDIELDQYGDVPITATQLLTDIANDFAAAIFCENHNQEFEDQVMIFRGRADRGLARYIHYKFDVSA